MGRGDGGDHGAEGVIVARVGDVAIGADVVAVEARATRGSARAAAEGLIAVELLAQEAERRGYASHELVAGAERRALVQGLLEETIERPNPPSSITMSELERGYLERIGEFRKPERRAAIHLLVRLDRDASAAQAETASAEVREILQSVRGSDDVRGQLEARREGTDRNARVLVEDIPPFDRTAPMAQAFITAVFAVQAPGLVPEPVHTPFGVHAILVTGIEPAVDQSMADVEDTLRRDLATAKRTRALDELIARLTREFVPQIDASVAARAFADPRDAAP